MKIWNKGFQNLAIRQRRTRQKHSEPTLPGESFQTTALRERTQEDLLGPWIEESKLGVWDAKVARVFSTQPWRGESCPEEHSVSAEGPWSLRLSFCKNVSDRKLQEAGKKLSGSADDPGAWWWQINQGLTTPLGLTWDWVQTSHNQLFGTMC